MIMHLSGSVIDIVYIITTHFIPTNRPDIVMPVLYKYVYAG